MNGKASPGSGAVDLDASSLRLQRNGEITIALDPAEGTPITQRHIGDAGP